MSHAKSLNNLPTVIPGAADTPPNVKDEPRPWLARAVLLGARVVTAMVVGSGALLGVSAGQGSFGVRNHSIKTIAKETTEMPNAK